MVVFTADSNQDDVLIVVATRSHVTASMDIVETDMLNQHQTTSYKPAQLHLLAANQGPNLQRNLRKILKFSLSSC